MVATDVPVVPDAETARRWAQDELADGGYQSGESGWLRRFIDWLQEIVTGFGDGVGGALGGAGAIVSIVVGLAIVGIAVWLIVGPLRRSRGRHVHLDVADEPSLTSVALSQRAATAAQEGRWDDAVVEAFRALVRRLDERGLIALRPGLTGHEAAAQAAVVRRDLADALRGHADRFDAVRYGHARGNDSDYRSIVTTINSVDAREVSVTL